MRTIEQVHRTRKAFIYKRAMDAAIVVDIFMVAINFPYWIDFSSDDH